jgi:hypothetical protein
MSEPETSAVVDPELVDLRAIVDGGIVALGEIVRSTDGQPLTRDKTLNAIRLVVQETLANRRQIQLLSELLKLRL